MEFSRESEGFEGLVMEYGAIMESESMACESGFTVIPL